MKKALLIALCLSWIGLQSAFATITLVASPSGQTVAANGTFTVSFTLQVTSQPPPDLIAVDYLLETAAANNNIFKVTNIDYTGSSFPNPNGVLPTGGDPLTTTGSTHSGFAQNNTDLGGNANNPLAVPGNYVVDTLTLMITGGTPGQTYTFNTTQLATSGTLRGSSVSSTIANPNTTTGAYYVDNPATFSVTVVPEPATWSLLGLGGLGAFGLNLLRARRRG